MKLNVYGYNLEVYHHPDGLWMDDRIIFEIEPDEQTRRDIIQYLYNEGFIADRRTAYLVTD
jgi:hypothetical protein